ncbi:MAG TPA: response regulator transcription factor [Bryobacteraceae bacterium]|nr:response regulator transcription factor [Bryobacteraceae bacterium]
MSRILIVEDEQHLANGLRFNLEADGHAVDVVDSGEAGLDKFRNERGSFDLLILDVMLPGLDGFAVMSHLRATGEFVPTLMLTARNRPEDVLRGFESGADDYLPKPFELPILLARIKGLLRRREWLQRLQPARDVFEFSGRVIDFDNLELTVGDKKLQLTLMEANLLRYLVARQGQVVSRQKLLEEVWGVREDTDTRAIDNFVVRLRRYIEDDASKPRHLLTVRGVGYKFLAEAAL